jgi:hypothetical protein
MLFVAGIPPATTRNSHISTLPSLPGRVYSVYINTPSWIKTSCPAMPLSHKQGKLKKSLYRKSFKLKLEKVHTFLQ